jgi:hypothetical protein
MRSAYQNIKMDKIDANTQITSAIKSEISNALRSNIEFNIAIGTANIRWLLEALKSDDKAFINKVMISYCKKSKSLMVDI